MTESFISKSVIHPGEIVDGKSIRKGIFEMIASEYPGFDERSCISINELNNFRRSYLASLLLAEKGELADIDRDVMDAIKNNAILSENIEIKIADKLTFGQRLSDNIASFGGSWRFIIIFGAFLIIWMSINIWAIFSKAFDPYPFILLNLILSCIAALQAPIIMMSQNRQDEKDRQRAEQDYKINLKAELEIKLLHEKIDHLLIHQNKMLLEFQEVQIDYLEDVINRLDRQAKDL